MQPDSPTPDKIADLDAKDLSAEESQQVKGGATPSAPQPTPLPYPNLKKILPGGIVPCV
jgi:hypothetical protein